MSLGTRWEGWHWLPSYRNHLGIGSQIPRFSLIYVDLEPDADTDSMVRLASVPILTPIWWWGWHGAPNAFGYPMPRWKLGRIASASCRHLVPSKFLVTEIPGLLLLLFKVINYIRTIQTLRVQVQTNYSRSLLQRRRLLIRNTIYF
jgi:hypothetical protein